MQGGEHFLPSRGTQAASLIDFYEIEGREVVSIEPKRSRCDQRAGM